MTFVRETHSIQVVVMESREHFGAKQPRRGYWKKVQSTILPKKKSRRDDYLCSETATSKGVMRARSESECEYSPQKRNNVQMLQKRGLAPVSYKRRIHRKKPR